MDLTRIKKKYKTKLFKNDLRFEAVAEATWKFTEHAMDHVAKEMGKAVKGKYKVIPDPCAEKFSAYIEGYNEGIQEIGWDIKRFLK